MDEEMVDKATAVVETNHVEEQTNLADESVVEKEVCVCVCVCVDLSLPFFLPICHTSHC